MWNNAPAEAEWIAMDKDGTWHWFSFWPVIGEVKWLYRGGGFYQEANIDEPFKGNWKDSLQPRPEGGNRENRESEDGLRAEKGRPVARKG